MLMQNQLERTIEETLAALQREFASAPEKILYWLGRIAVDLYTRSLLRLDVHWLAPLPAGPKILAANHPTTTDPFFILTLVPEQVSVLVTSGAFDVPGFGTYLRRAGHVPVVRNGGGATIEAAARLLEAGRTVAIFPEGALSPLEGSLSGGIGVHPPRSGAARLALMSGAPVVPVGIGLDPGRIRFVDVELEGKPEQGRFYAGGPYALTVGRPMWFQGSVDRWEYVRQVSKHIMDRILRLSQESYRRLDAPQASTPAPALSRGSVISPVQP